jgi:type IV pilus assembly protein PilO
MSDFFDRIAALRPLAKFGIVLGILAVVCGGYWYFFYSDMIDESTQIENQTKQASDERDAYALRKKEYQAFRLEVTALLDEQKELLRQLPKTDDIEQFIENMNAQVELSGLAKVSSVRDSAVPEEMYKRIPVKMSLTGGYHQINRFFKNVGELKRIVTIADLQLSPSVSGNQKPGQPLETGLLKADFTAQTFQFIDRPGAKPAATAPGAAPPPPSPAVPR